MKKLFLSTTLFILCLVLGFSAHATDVGGPIEEDTIWTKAGSPYVVISNVTVIEDVTLTIKPGVEVKFNQGKALLIDGTLVARGTSSEKIAFTSNGEQKAGYWGYIFFSDSSTILMVSIRLSAGMRLVPRILMPRITIGELIRNQW